MDLHASKGKAWARLGSFQEAEKQFAKVLELTRVPTENTNAMNRYREEARQWLQGRN